MPNFPLVDAHVHLYDPRALRFPWMDAVPALDAPHGLPEFSRAIGTIEVDGLVFVEVDAAPDLHLAEARWVEAHAGDDPRVRGIVGSLPLERGPGAVEADLAAFARLPRARGVRRLLQGHADEPGWALRAPFVEAVRLLATHDLPFDLCVRQGQLREAATLVRRCPEVRFVLDHLGKPALASGALDPWRDDFAALAAEPNVVCKLSGLVTEADVAAWTYDDLAPAIHHALDHFGFDRVMFGGDWPVCEQASPYARWVAAVDRATAGVAEADLRKLYREVAIRTYRL